MILWITHHLLPEPKILWIADGAPPRSIRHHPVPAIPADQRAYRGEPPAPPSVILGLPSMRELQFRSSLEPQAMVNVQTWPMARSAYVAADVVAMPCWSARSG
jgi:hypothetical protein